MAYRPQWTWQVSDIELIIMDWTRGIQNVAGNRYHSISEIPDY